MNPVSYELFLPYVLTRAPNCLEPMALSAIRDACIMFARDTFILQEDLDPIDSEAGVGTYDLGVPSGSEVWQLLSLYYSGRRLQRRAQSDLEKQYSLDWQLLSGSPQAYTCLSPDTFTVALAPNESVTGAFTGRVVLVPSRSSKTVDGVLFERYVHAIADGALMRLLKTPDQQFTDPKQAADCEQQFRNARARARVEINSGAVGAPLRVRFQRVF